jgi:hypothetical protein
VIRLKQYNIDIKDNISGMIISFFYTCNGLDEAIMFAKSESQRILSDNCSIEVHEMDTLINVDISSSATTIRNNKIKAKGAK